MHMRPDRLGQNGSIYRRIQHIDKHDEQKEQYRGAKAGKNYSTIGDYTLVCLRSSKKDNIGNDATTTITLIIYS